MTTETEQEPRAEAPAPEGSPESDKDRNFSALRKKVEAAEARAEAAIRERDEARNGSAAKPAATLADDDLPDVKATKQIADEAATKAANAAVATLEQKTAAQQKRQSDEARAAAAEKAIKDKHPALWEKHKADMDKLIAQDEKWKLYPKELFEAVVPEADRDADIVARHEKNRLTKEREFRARPGMPPTTEPGPQAATRAPGMRGFKERVRAAAQKNVKD